MSWKLHKPISTTVEYLNFDFLNIYGDITVNSNKSLEDFFTKTVATTVKVLQCNRIIDLFEKYNGSH